MEDDATLLDLDGCDIVVVMSGTLTSVSCAVAKVSTSIKSGIFPMSVCE